MNDDSAHNVVPRLNYTNPVTFQDFCQIYKVIFTHLFFNKVATLKGIDSARRRVT